MSEVFQGSFIRVWRTTKNTELFYHLIDLDIPLAPFTFYDTLPDTAAYLGSTQPAPWTLSRVSLTDAVQGSELPRACKYLAKWQDRKDREAGKLAEQKRNEFVELERKRVEDRAPIQIETPVLEIPKSERVKKESQASLFEAIPDSPLPPLHLLDEPKGEVEIQSAETLEFTSRLIERKLMDFGIEVKVLAAMPGPVITRYELEPAAGVKGSQILNLSKDLARALSVVSIRVVETIPGKSCMGLEIPNPKRQIVFLSEIMGV